MDKVRHARDDGFTMMELTVVLFVMALVTSASLIGYRSYIHGANISALSQVIRNVRTASHQYIQINSSYTGLSCPSLSASGIWPPSGCNGSSFALSIPQTSVSVATGATPYQFSIVILSSYFTDTDFEAICNQFESQATQCSPSSGTLTLVF
jgi:prepilin-type N-terminal cleavage/methylation domain-containing protein